MEAKKTRKTQPGKIRDTNLELYRIIVMFLIVIHHYVVNSGLTAADGPIYGDPLSWRSMFLLFTGAWGAAGINCFVLITGYFMCKSNITLKKFVKLAGEFVFYRVIIQSIFWITGHEAFSLGGLFNVLNPIDGINQNFVGSFLVFFLLIPFLNILVRHITAKQHIALILLCAFIYILPGTLPVFPVTMNRMSWFIVLYFISAFVRLRPHPVWKKTALWGVATAVCVGISVVSVVCCAWLGTRLGRNMAYLFVGTPNTFLAVATGFCSFLLFKNWKIKQSKLINTVAASTFGVLCIHANSAVMRDWLWKDLVQPVEHYGSFWMPVHAIGWSLLIFAVCIGVDYLRIRFIETPFMYLWDVVAKNITKRQSGAVTAEADCEKS